MSQTIFKTDAILDGYQAVFRPSKFGYSLSCIVEQDFIDKLEIDRIETLKWAESKLKNKKRSTLKPEPWEEISDGVYKVKFSWNEEMKPEAFDCNLNALIDAEIPLFSGSTVAIACYQKPYILKEGITYGTSLKLVGFQVLSLANPMDGIREVKSLFEKREGYVYKPVDF